MPNTKYANKETPQRMYSKSIWVKLRFEIVHGLEFTQGPRPRPQGPQGPQGPYVPGRYILKLTLRYQKVH